MRNGRVSMSKYKLQINVVFRVLLGYVEIKRYIVHCIINYMIGDVNEKLTFTIPLVKQSYQDIFERHPPHYQVDLITTSIWLHSCSTWFHRYIVCEYNPELHIFETRTLFLFQSHFELIRRI